MASAAARRFRPPATWLQSFTTWPAPFGPTWTMVLPMAWSTGRQRSNTASSPPTMIASVPAFAPISPPEMGASSMSTPFAASSFATFRAVSGAIVEQSMYVEPA